MHKRDLVLRVVAIAFLVVFASLVLTTVVLFIVSPADGIHVAKNHLKHYVVGFIVAAPLIAYYWRKLSWAEHILFFLMPSLVASGWPDLVYFVSYVVQHGSFAGVLYNKNIVYHIMHRPVVVISAAPVLTGFLYWVNRRLRLVVEKRVKWWVLIVLALTFSLSLFHVLSDARLGF